MAPPRSGVGLGVALEEHMGRRVCRADGSVVRADSSVETGGSVVRVGGTGVLALADDPIVLGGALAPREIETLAQRVMRQIRPHICGPVWDPEMWKRVAVAMGAMVRRIRSGQGTGYYDVESGTIFVKTTGDDWTLSRRIVHELGHHVLIEYKIRPRRRPLERYDDNRLSVEHRVCCRVELLAVGG